MKQIVVLITFLHLTGFLGVWGSPYIVAESAIAVDLETGEIIYSKSIDRKMYPASITKLATAIILAERMAPTDVLFYSATAKSTPAFSLDLSIGETISAAQAMDTLLLYSANDIAVMIAENVAGNVESFSNLMNQMAGELGLSGTNFTNPSGLHHPGHFTTAFDLSKLAAALYSYPWIMESISQSSALIETSSGWSREVENRNKLVGVNGCVGGKTGYTSEAGRSLLALYEREGRRIAAVVLKSVLDPEDTVAFSDMETLVDFSYAAERVPYFDRKTFRIETSVEYRTFYFLGPLNDLMLPLGLQDEVLLFSNGEGYSTDYSFGTINPWKLDRGVPAGMLTVKQREWQANRPLYPLLDRRDLLKRNLPTYLITLGILALGTMVIVFCLKTLLYRRRVTPKS